MSGEIIQLPNTDNLIFEPMDLEAASPATVSRCGMIYMEPNDLGWEPLLSSWLNTLPELTPDYIKEHLAGLFNRFCPNLLHLVRKGGLKELSPTSNSVLINSAMNIVESLMDDYKEEKYVKSLNANTHYSRIEGIFTFAITWSLGATTDEDGRAKFDYLFKQLVKTKRDEDVKEGKERQERINCPTEKTLFNWKFVKEGIGLWEPFENDLKTLPVIPREMQMNQIIIPTIDTIRYSWLMKILVTHGKNVLLVGPTGKFFAQLLEEGVLVNKFSFKELESQFT